MTMSDSIRNATDYDYDSYGSFFMDINTGTVTDDTIVTSREVTLFITLTCCIGPLNVIGIFTNALSVLVFQRYPSRGSTTFLLQILSVADSVFLFNNILYLSVQYYFAYVGKFLNFYKLYGNFLPFLMGFTELSRDYSVWCVVKITVDRYLGICYPLSSPKWCDVPMTAVASILVLVYCIAFNIPQFLFSKIENFGGHYELVATELGNNFIFNVVYFTFDVLLNLLIPVFVVLYMNCRICYELIRARRNRLTMARGNVPRHNKMTSMLITVAIFFLICQVPRVIVTIYNCHTLYSQLYNQENILTNESAPFALYTISNILQNFSALCNFWVYCITGRQFRMVLGYVCMCRRQRRFHRASFSEDTGRFSLGTSTLRKISS